MLPVLFLTLLSWVAGMSDCTAAECPAAKQRSSSLLQVKVKRNQGALDVPLLEADVSSQTSEVLLQTVIRIANDRMQAAASGPVDGNGTDSGADSGSTSKLDTPETTLQAIELHILQTLVPDVKNRTARDQALLEEAHRKLLGCALTLSAEEESAGVGDRHAEHDSCRKIEAENFKDKKEKCRARDDFAKGLGQVPGCDDPIDAHDHVERWREYFETAVPMVEEHHTKFKDFDGACIAAEQAWTDKKKECKSKQAAYEAVVCDTQEHRQDGVGVCLDTQIPEYNETIQLVAAREGERVADYTSAKRILCYLDAMSKDEGFTEATHDCHNLEVDTSSVRLEYPGWPSPAVDVSKMYPCGKVWLSYAYGSLPADAPHDKCTKCPNLPDLDGSGSTFIRWGALSCPDPSSLVYRGFAAGSAYNYNGNGANFICLVEDPTVAPATTAGNENHAMIHGIQYRDTYAGTNNQHGDVACSTCAFNGATYTTWGSTACKSGHVEIYSGNVMSSHHGHKKGEHICVDSERRTHTKSSAGNDAAMLLYMAEYECGSLPCGPFDGTKEVACVVCGIPDEPAAVYQRWGHDECSDGSELIYTGLVGGSHYGHAGGGYNPICLTMEPTDAPDTAGGSQNHVHIYGTEYESNYVGKNAANHDAACAVCQWKGKTSYNVWGTDVCGGGHVKLYSGNVWSDYHGHQRTELLCVDPAHKSHARTNNGDNNGQLWYMAEYECGALSCTSDSGFTEGMEVACAVCGVPENQGAVFTRWGHTDCPASSTKVYSGAVAGASDSHAGGSANAICLTNSPTVAHDNNNGNQGHARVYGVEYGPMYAGENHEHWDAGCAVCAYQGLAAYKSWGSTKCRDGHDKLYDGSVMAGHHGHKKFNYECVDQARAERLIAPNRGNQNPSGTWWLAEYECGSLPCDPYHHTNEAACSVCGIPGLEGTGMTMSCSGYGTKASCPRGQCMWVGHACQAACLEFRTNTSCPAQCVWDDYMGLCQEPCEDFSTLDECPTGRCWWRDDTCTTLGVGATRCALSYAGNDIQWTLIWRYSGGTSPLSVWRPERKSYCSLGDIIIKQNVDTIPPDTAADFVGANVGRPPIDFKWIAAENQATGINYWEPLCEDGYISLGDVSINKPERTENVKPPVTSACCVPESFGVPYNNAAGTQEKIWSDGGTGGMDNSQWLRKGLQTFITRPNHSPPNIDYFAGPVEDC